MPFRRYAKALTSKRNIQFECWMDELRKQAADAIPEKQVLRTAKEVLTRCDPNQYLLSHATIVASVDSYTPKGAKTGRSLCERGSEIDVRFTDYRIKPESQELINNNGDCWERALLMSSYKSFVGAPNYLEHIQLPALSKGFIVDAIARDIGRSCYIDILVATDRRHNQLINDIISGKMQALSMGCISLFTVCTRCGNVASDDSQLCSHVMYDGKLSEWVDKEGQSHRLSELIGHVTIPNSNQFIEASWVHNPAFRGAVRRNLLNADQIAGTPGFAAQMDDALEVSDFRNGTMDFSVPSRAASTRIAVDPPADDDPSDDAPSDDAPSDDSDSSDLDFDSPDGTSGLADAGGDDKKAEPSSKDKIHGLADKVKEQILEMVVKDLGEELKPQPDEVGTASPPSADLNNTILTSSDFEARLRVSFKDHPKLVQWAITVNKALKSPQRTRVYSRLTARDLIVFSWINDCVNRKNMPHELYQISMDVGSISKYPSQKSFVAACSMRLKRPVGLEEKNFFLAKGRVAALSNHS